LTVHSLQHAQVQLATQLVQTCHVAQRIRQTVQLVLSEQLLHLAELVACLELAEAIGIQQTQAVEGTEVVA
jgi:hypothetical protein